MAVRRPPSLLATWDPYAGSDFVQYNVYVRERRAVYDARETVAASVDGCVTDALRGLGAEGDDRAYPDDSVGAWPSTTNYVSNPGAESDLTGHTAGGNSHARSTEQVKFGSYSVKKTYNPGGTAYFGTVTFTVNAAGVHYAHLWGWIPTSWDGGTLGAHLINLSAVSGTTSANFNMATRDAWQQLTIGPFTLSTDLAGSIETYITSGSTPTAGSYFYLDAWQVEKTRVTPYAASSRANGRIQIPTDVLSAVVGGVSLRARLSWGNSTEPASSMVFLDYRDDASNYLKLEYDGTANAWKLTRCVAGTTSTVSVADTVATDDKVLLTAYWDTTTIGLAVDAGSISTAAAASDEVEFATALADLGSLAGASHAYADLFWAVFFHDAPSAADVTALHGYGDDAPAPEDLRDLSSARPVAIWDARNPEQVTQVERDAWVNVVTVTDQGTPSYAYESPASGQNYEFAVTVTANVFGDIIEGEKPTAVHDSVTFDDWYLQEVGIDGPHFAYLSSGSASVEVRQEISYVRPRGRVAPSAQIGEYEARRVTLSGVPRYHESERAEWERLYDLVRRQRTTGAVLLLRPPHVPERYFGQVDPTSRSDTVPSYGFRLDLQEVHYDEAVA